MPNDEFCSIEWDIQPDEMLNNAVAQYSQTIQETIYRIVKDYEPTIVQWMKDNAPWQDVTGQARNDLVTSSYMQFNDTIVLVLTNSVVYGTYLEGWNPRSNAAMINAGDWAIIQPAIEKFGPLIWSAIKGLF